MIGDGSLARRGGTGHRVPTKDLRAPRRSRSMPLHISEMFTRDVTIGFLAMMRGAAFMRCGASGS
jgi:hypothetical protein